MSKYELTISTGYVPTWTYIEAVRELFQNAIDNETVNPDNGMLFEYTDGTLRVSNKTSVLSLDTLLIGSSSKREDTRTIGQHGEGYKIAFMVLLRENKKVKVYNYGANEVWTAKLVKSRRYNGAEVVQIDVNKKPFWERIPDHNLTVEIEGITYDEYEQIKDKNLNIRDASCVDGGKFGRLLTDESEKGKIYIKGLYVCTNDKIAYGYDFSPEIVKLDRDRQLVDSFNIGWNSSQMWIHLLSNNIMNKECKKLIWDEALDVVYITDVRFSNNADNVVQDLAREVIKDIEDKYCENAIPVSNQSEYERASESGYTPVIVPNSIYKVVACNSEVYVKCEKISKKETLRSRMTELVTKYKEVISEEDYTEIINGIEEMVNCMR